MKKMNLRKKLLKNKSYHKIKKTEKKERWWVRVTQDTSLGLNNL